MACRWHAVITGMVLTADVDKASSGIVDEVGVSLPGRSIGLLWRFGHAQIYTGNLGLMLSPRQPEGYSSGGGDMRVTVAVTVRQ